MNGRKLRRWPFLPQRGQGSLVFSLRCLKFLRLLGFKRLKLPLGRLDLLLDLSCIVRVGRQTCFQAGQRTL